MIAAVTTNKNQFGSIADLMRRLRNATLRVSGWNWYIISVATNKPMPSVEAIARCEEGRALLELRNDYAHAVTVRHLLFSAPELTGTSALVACNLELAASSSRVVDVTSNLQAFSGIQRAIAISMLLEPPPPERTAPPLFRFTILEGRCLEFARRDSATQTATPAA